VFSRLAEETFWAKVLNPVGFNVLMTPFEPDASAFSAWSRWHAALRRTPREGRKQGGRRMSAFSD